MLYDDNTASQTFELYGPKQYSTAELAEIVDKEIVKHRRHINLPKVVLKPAAYYLNKYLWWPTMSADQIEREFIDQHIDPTAKTFKDLDIEPAEITSLTYLYLVSLDLDSPLTHDKTNDDIDGLPKLSILRLAPRHRARAKRREEVPARPG